MLKTIKTDIIPSKQFFVKVGESNALDKKAICVFFATGFFLDNDTYWKDVKTLRPGTINTIDQDNNLISSKTWFNWYYEPKDKSFEEVVSEFSTLFDTINEEQLQDKKIILPISGGLDSRSQVVSLLNKKAKINSYSYSFTNGYKESAIAKKIAKKASFSFKEFLIPPNYLWNKIDDAALINKCYSEFTHCRQVGVLDEFDSMGEIFSLGHWGDVLFDKVTDKELSNEKQIELLYKKVIKPKGLDLAKDLWKEWELDGDFEDYLKSRIEKLLAGINIKNTNAKLRAFKSLYWAPRWTSIGLTFFASKHQMSLPYYDNRMCEFICNVPEEFLADRKIQIAYIKAKSTKIAKVTWQDARPFNLYNYNKNKVPYNLPYRLFNKFKREINKLLGKKYIQRNWELQFLGKKNKAELINYFNTSNILQVVGKDIVDKTINEFYSGNQKHTSHSLSMLLTLAVFSKNFLYHKEKHIKNL